MKKKYTYPATIILFALAICFIYWKYKSDQRKLEANDYELLRRRGPSALTPEWASIEKNASALQVAIKKNPNDAKSKLAMAALFIQEARVTGNYIYYDKAAMKYVNQVLTKEPLNFTGLIFKSLIYLSQHHFAEGLDFAQQAQKVNPYNAYVYGLLVDGSVEMGNYTAAVENSDKMVSIRPDLRSYSRISYLREIHGDYPGAIEAMKMAVDAGPPGEESTEWTRIQLGHLYENTGDLRGAEMQYSIALEERPQYAFATAGLGHLMMASKNYKKAIEFYQQAETTLNDISFREQLVELYNLANQKEKAKTEAKKLIDELSRDAQKGQQDESIGHYSDRELAYAYLDVNDYEKALAHASIEYNRRPGNIDVNETMAWIYFKMNNAQKALPFIATALKTNSKNPTLLCQAGLIYLKNGDTEKGNALMNQGLAKNPNISPILKEECMSKVRAN
ncbi:MAG: hypothetical protein NVS1B13_11510 [Flavisolibacter sp.]